MIKGIFTARFFLVLIVTVAMSLNLRQTQASGETVQVAIGSLPVGKTLTIGFRARINAPLPVGVTQIENQGVVTGQGFAPILTDDPDIFGVDDPTITGLFLPQRQPRYPQLHPH